MEIVKFEIGQVVNHRGYGRGVVVEIQPRIIQLVNGQQIEDQPIVVVEFENAVRDDYKEEKVRCDYYRTVVTKTNRFNFTAQSLSKFLVDENDIMSDPEE